MGIRFFLMTLSSDNEQLIYGPSMNSVINVVLHKILGKGEGQQRDRITDGQNATER